MNVASFSRRRLLATGVAVTASAVTFAANARAAHVTAVTFAPDGAEIVTGSQAGVFLHHAGTLEVVREIATQMDQVHDLRFSADGQWLAVAGGTPGESGSVELLAWPSGKLRWRAQTHDDVVYQVDIAADASRVVTAAADEVCSVYAMGDDKPSTRFTKHSRPVLAVILLPDATTAVSGSSDETLRVWDAKSGHSLRTLHNHSHDVHALALKPGALQPGALQPGSAALPLVASASDDRTVRFWQPTIGRMVRFARLPSAPLSIAWVDGGTKLVAGCRDGKARLIDPVTVKVIDTVDIGDGWLYAIGVDPTNDRHVVFGGADGLIQVHTF